MFCCVRTNQWSADTGYICDDDQEQEVEALKDELKRLLAPESPGYYRQTFCQHKAYRCN